MSGYILHDGAIVACRHPPGLAQPDQTDTRVTVSGRKVMTVSRTYTVSGCALNSTNSPACTKASWLQGAQRVTASGLAVAIDSGESLCTPSNGTLDPRVFQQRVTAS
jgi:hypothetical protein